jgi:nucleotide-binding universal stress UspA family protein
MTVLTAAAERSFRVRIGRRPVGVGSGFNILNPGSLQHHAPGEGEALFRRILVGFDGSEHAQRALEAAIELADSGGGAWLTLICVVQPLRQVMSPGLYVAPTPSLEQLEAEARQGLERAAALVPDGIPVAKIVAHGSPARAILARIDAGAHDLVVVGSRGRDVVRSLLLGSVSLEVLTHSSVPVLIAHCTSRADPEQRTYETNAA